MQELKRDDIERLVALQSNKYKKDVQLILDTYYTVLREAILTGLKISIPGVGSFSNTQVNAKPERMGVHPATREETVFPAHEAFNKPTFRFKPGVRAEMRERTEGKVF